ncbi:MAG: hypothetical protein KAV83_04940 [Desulfobacterales bacterium]|nr:hypothetical protein [Desulfobacterales bacterium]
MDDITKTVGGFRAAIQDLLVPELKAIQTELKHHTEEFARIDKRFEAVDRRFEAVDRRFEAMFQSLRHIETTQSEILEKLDVKEEVSQYTSKTNAFSPST